MTIADKRDVKKEDFLKILFHPILRHLHKIYIELFLRIITDNTDVKKPPIEYNTGIQA